MPRPIVRIVKQVFVYDEALFFKHLAYEEVCKWSSIKYLFTKRFCHFMTAQCEDGSVYCGQVSPDRMFSSVNDKIQIIYEMWYDEIKDKGAIESFILCPNWHPKRNWPIAIFIFFIFWILAVVLLLAGIVGQVLFFLLFGGAIVLLANFLKSPNFISEISQNDDSLNLIFSRGNIKSYAFEEICVVNLDKAGVLKKIRFSDGYVLKNIEGFSYWVVLRERILNHKKGLID